MEWNRSCEVEIEGIGDVSLMCFVNFVVSIQFSVIPEFVNSSSGLLVVSNENERNVSLRCIYRGIRQPTVTWYSPTGSVVVEGARNESAKTVIPHVYSSRLILDSVAKSDEGNFTCSARNSNGSASQPVYLRVQGRIVSDKLLQCVHGNLQDNNYISVN